MKPLLFALTAALLFLAGCVPGPNLISVSKDGTIAFYLAESMTEEGDSDSTPEYSHHTYLTNANADFLTEVQELEGCWCPLISPSGRYIAAYSEDDLVLYDRTTKKRRVIYRSRKDDDGLLLILSAWSPDGKKIAFLAGDLEDAPQNCTLKVYDVKRRELEVVARGASLQATWLPDSNRLLYVSVPPGPSGNDGLFFGGLKMINVRTGKQKTLAHRELISFTKIAVFPDGKSILFPCVDWEDMEIGRAGVTAPIVLRKECLSGLGKKGARRKRGEMKEEEASEPAETDSKPDGEETPDAAGEEKPEEEGFVLREGQPFCPFSCAVSPDGKKIAYFRYIWVPGSARHDAVEEEEGRTQGEQPEEAGAGAEGPEENDEEGTEPDGVELCVAGADGTGSIAIARSVDDGFPQVLWLSDTRLIYVTDDKIILVDADGKNELDLIETLRSKFPEQFEEKQQEETQPEKETLPLEETHNKPLTPV